LYSSEYFLFNKLIADCGPSIGVEGDSTPLRHPRGGEDPLKPEWDACWVWIPGQAGNDTIGGQAGNDTSRCNLERNM